MTIATLTPSEVSISGLLENPTALGATDTGFNFVNDGSTLLLVENGSGSAVTVTLDAQTYGGLSLVDPTVSIAAGATKIIGPFKPSLFNDSNGKVTATISTAATTVKGQAIRVPTR